MGSHKSAKVEKFLNSNPDFLASYLQKRMQEAVSSYLEHNPQFLNEFLQGRPPMCHEHAEAVPNKTLPDMVNTNRSPAKEEFSRKTSKSLFQNVQVTPSMVGPSHRGNSASGAKEKNTERTNVKLRPPHFSLHGQQNQTPGLNLSLASNENRWIYFFKVGFH